MDFLAFLIAVNPDYIIRQSPWDADIPNIYSSVNLSKYKMIYIPYFTLDVVDDFKNGNVNMEINQNFHLCCTKIYMTSQIAFERAKQDYLGDKSKIQFLGNTKLEYITQKFKKTNENLSSGVKNILWCPHHSIASQWLAFGTFEKNCLLFIELAKTYGDKIHIKLRPHPLLWLSMQNSFPELLVKFKQEWQELNNVSLDEDWDYLASFEWSDMLVTDGISFLAEYPLTNKPIIYIENPNHLPFDENGVLAKRCCHTVQENDELMDIIHQAISGNLIIKADEINHYKTIVLVENDVAKTIVDDFINL